MQIVNRMWMVGRNIYMYRRTDFIPRRAQIDVQRGYVLFPPYMLNLTSFRTSCVFLDTRQLRISPGKYVSACITLHLLSCTDLVLHRKFPDSGGLLVVREDLYNVRCAGRDKLRIHIALLADLSGEMSLYLLNEFIDPVRDTRSKSIKTNFHEQKRRYL